MIGAHKRASKPGPSAGCKNSTSRSNMNNEIGDAGHWEKTLKIRQKSLNLVNRKWGASKRSWFLHIANSCDKKVPEEQICVHVSLSLTEKDGTDWNISLLKSLN